MIFVIFCIILHILWLKSTQKVVLTSKNWFWPANIVRSTCTLVEIHNSQWFLIPATSHLLCHLSLPLGAEGNNWSPITFSNFLTFSSLPRSKSPNSQLGHWLPIYFFGLTKKLECFDKKQVFPRIIEAFKYACLNRVDFICREDLKHHGRKLRSV